MEIWENFNGEDYPLTKTSYKNVSIAYAQVGDMDKAHEYAAKADDQDLLSYLSSINQ